MMHKPLTLQGYLVDYDKYDRAKLMFLDDYDCEKNISFTKRYLLSKSKTIEGNNPIIDDKYFLINCKKNGIGLLPDESNNLIKRVPIEMLKQHKVECSVYLKAYKFFKNEVEIKGWNLRLISMKLIEY